MDITESAIQLDWFMTLTLGIIVLFIGKRLTGMIGFLREYSIPEPVSGGLAVSLLCSALFMASGYAIAIPAFLALG